MAVEFDELVERYLAIWNETDPARRRREIDDLFAAEGRYVDPLVVAEGRDAVDATIAAVQDRFPGMSFRAVGPVDGHHQQVRFAWELGPEGVEAPIAGFDVATVDDDGRLTQVLGFLDRVPVE
ncbi:nuclear transport factor 2 family protein [Micromonospora sp. NPDC047793]|uniref:nuclear transport factor 2 family protein n=1 Tax=unclassified Micromonospora TaxID=2617518 RepID=UPI00103402F0|nr:nuclear transport factor 2 family protein [Verrucosispora sp. SN26_14.1]TBL35052.1 nuclear transport factor 2 family protein [Verrucosispora sp. SN26_14.1]